MEKQEHVWNSIADEWNQHRKDEMPVVKKFLEGKRGSLLDLGCGSGRNFFFNPDLKWSCVDFSEKMLKHAGINAGKTRIKAEFFHSETHKLNFEDNFFDNILCYSVLHCVDTHQKREETLRELFRVLRKGGEGLISVWSKNSPRLKNKGKECYISWKISITEKKMRYTYIYELQELKNLLEKIGFEILHVEEHMNIDFIVKKP